MMLAFLRLRMNQDEFLICTPRYISDLFKQFNKDEMNIIHNNWERTRLSLYYTIQMKNPISYKTFCNQFLPFTWDPKEPELSDDEIREMTTDDPFSGNLKREVLTDASHLKGIL
jgi:hypothetical protein